MSSKKQHSGSGSSFLVQEHLSEEDNTLSVTASTGDAGLSCQASGCGWQCCRPPPRSPAWLVGPGQAPEPCMAMALLQTPRWSWAPSPISARLSPSVVLLATVTSCAAPLPVPEHGLRSAAGEAE